MAHLRIENDYLRTPEFLKFLGSNECRVLLFLMAHIVRNVDVQKAPPGAIQMYKRYYKANKLCASYSMSNIAQIFGWMSKGKPNKSHVSKIIKVLSEMGLIKIITENTPLGQKYVYQLGYYKGIFGQDKIEEVLFFDNYFKECVKKREREIRDEQLKKVKEDLRRMGHYVPVDKEKEMELRKMISKIDLRG